MMKPRAGKSLVKIAIIALALLPNLILAQQESDERAYFSTLVYNHSIYAVGGTMTQFSILDYTNGIDVNTLKWQLLKYKIPPYEHGVAFKDANGDFLLQAGGNSTTDMEEMVKCTHKTLSCTSALSLKNSPPVTALMTATVNPNTNLVYYYGGVMVNTVTHEYRMTTNASSTFTSLDTTKNPMAWESLNPSYPNAHRPSRAGHSSNIM
ncbi:hypothetical protein G6F57_008963 [Rhizopus arrhizus]|uniref:Uncharacterized protein n=1 Tax=Rhizopus oryzae TaxID=64495 RepID=A0A9P6X4D0_RHIOR|nr:hypothetical protein G6F30_009692 [Rhizopus arrhizus]KAG1417930.1 hypothetical protein G6F58_005282 [Rhizopus delemar]KAG0977660.1 hypothetical protein G6F29_009900 [Rhizopus arrhizus]KAG0997517.1 hypothetical protein G6F28_002825 [Rhizopus arrhizus]KAG1276919.1 hypothetical protein G6F65_008900 [Rhizopus arrhizus]